jgi:segregation and condensation protein B
VLSTLLDRRLITTAGRKEVMGRPILYKSSKEFLMRFGLSDLDELPSLKEFEALAREALGSDVGVTIGTQTEEELMNAPTADTLENLPLPENGAADKELIEEEVAATNEGMPAGELDEEPRKADAASAGE